MLRQITDMETWLMDNDHRIFRYLVYRRMFTPYEQEKKFVDESEFQDNHYNFGFIEEAIDLGSGEWMVGFRPINDCSGVVCDRLEYFNLKEIRIEYFEKDQSMCVMGDEDEE